MNRGEVMGAVAAYMASEESSIHSLETIRQASAVAGQAYRSAAALVFGFRCKVLGEILVDIASLVVAILVPGVGTAAALVRKKLMSLMINAALDAAIQGLLGE